MARTDPTKVRSVIDTKEDIDLTEFIEVASDIVDEIAIKGVLGAVRLEKIETYLAAHYYSLRDPQYQSQTIGKTSATYNKRDWWEEARKLDTTGTLAAMQEGTSKMSLSWLGTPKSEQIDHWNRN